MWPGLSSGPVAKNPPCNAGVSASIHDWGTRVPHTAEQLKPCASIAEPVLHS